MNLSLFLARKIVGSKEKNTRKVSRPAIKIAIMGVAVGICIMLMSVSIVLGFKGNIRDKVVGFGSHIVVENKTSLETGDTYPIQIDAVTMDKLSKIEGVSHVQRFANTQGILKTEEDFLGVNLKGVSTEWDSTFIHSNMQEGYIPRFGTSALFSNQIVISKSIADKLKLKKGEKVFAYFIGKQGVRMRRFLVAGIYETNMTQYDQVVCFADLQACITINGWEQDECSGAELQISDFSQLNTVASRVKDKIDGSLDDYGNTYGSKDIKALSPHIFAWLDLLDMNVWVILGLMMLVSAVTMISGLLIIILERTQMIGTLKALGARNSLIRRTFLWFGGVIVLKGLAWGNALAFILLAVQDHFHLAKLDAQAYYVSTVPIAWCWQWFIVIDAATFLVSILILAIPSMLVSNIHPAKSIKFD